MNKFKKIISWLIVFIIMALIYYFSDQVSELSSGTSSSLSRLIFDTLNLDRLFIFDNFHSLVRKIAHFIIYFTLGLSVYNALFLSFKNKYINILIITIFILLLYASFDEIHQLFVPGRSGEIRDVIIDTTGGSLGGMLYYFYLKIGCVKHDL